jgi:hypothetical protein
MFEATDTKGRVPLLGQLAGEGWFMRRGEVAATWALTCLSADPRLRTALVEYLGGVAKLDLSAAERFVAETVQDDFSRPDIEMFDSVGHTVALVEVKFGAELSAGQVAAYLDVLARRSGPYPGALFVLVPPSRVREADGIITAVLEARPGAARMVVLTWDEWIAVWERVASESDDSELASDLTQLKAMCRTLGGLVMPPLEGTATGENWQGRASDLVTIVKQLTEQFLGSSTFPMQGDLVSKPWAYRYLPSISPNTWVQVGVWGQFADEGQTPFWLMLHKDDRGSGGFASAKERIMASEFSRRVRRDDGHVWVPLDAPANATGPELVDALATQLDAVLATLRP